MKMLYLVRHAKSSWSDPELSDFDRPLNDRGRRDAPQMGKRLKEKEITPDLMLSSPAKRALTTCKEIAKILEHPLERIKTDRDIYHADKAELYQIVIKLEDSNKIVLLFGHNPGFTEFANSLMDEPIINIPTCGIIASKLNINSWKDIKPGCATMDFFDFPKKNKRK